MIVLLDELVALRQDNRAAKTTQKGARVVAKLEKNKCEGAA
jgi:hypothetical protein